MVKRHQQQKEPAVIRLKVGSTASDAHNVDVDSLGHQSDGVSNLSGDQTALVPDVTLSPVSTSGFGIDSSRRVDVQTTAADLHRNAQERADNTSQTIRTTIQDNNPSLERQSNSISHEAPAVTNPAQPDDSSQIDLTARQDHFESLQKQQDQQQQEYQQRRDADAARRMAEWEEQGQARITQAEQVEDDIAAALAEAVEKAAAATTAGAKKQKSTEPIKLSFGSTKGASDSGSSTSSSGSDARSVGVSVEPDSSGGVGVKEASEALHGDPTAQSQDTDAQHSPQYASSHHDNNDNDDHDDTVDDEDRNADGDSSGGGAGVGNADEGGSDGTRKKRRK